MLVPPVIITFCVSKFVFCSTELHNNHKPAVARQSRRTASRRPGPELARAGAVLQRSVGQRQTRYQAPLYSWVLQPGSSAECGLAQQSCICTDQVTVYSRVRSSTRLGGGRVPWFTIRAAGPGGL